MKKLFKPALFVLILAGLLLASLGVVVVQARDIRGGMARIMKLSMSVRMGSILI